MADQCQLKLNSPEWWDMHAKRWEELGTDRDRPEEYQLLIRQMKRGPLLEVGPGFGSFCKHLPRRFDYVGWDISEEMVAMCRKRFPYRLFVQMDFLQINEFAFEKSFEHVVALQTLEHFTRAHFNLAMLIIQKICRKSLLFSVPKGVPTEAIRQADGHLIGWKDDEAVYNDFSRFGRTRILYNKKRHIAGEVSYE
jgi:SAM-dependent methyltransferase